MGRPEEAAAAVDSGGRLARHLLAAVACACCAAGNGIAIGWGVSANWQLQQAGGDLTLVAERRAWLMSVMYLGTAVGCLLAGRLGARYGPRAVMLLSLVPTTAGHATVALAGGFGALLLGRLVVGVASGMPCSVFPQYVASTAVPARRGAYYAFSDIVAIMAIIGVVALGDCINWRWLAACCTLNVVPSVLLLLPLPEDPTWLMRQGRLEEAKRAADFFGVDLAPADNDDNDEPGRAATLRLFTRRSSLAPLIITLTLLLISSFSGYLAILSYSLEFFRQAGFALGASVCSMLFCGIRVLAILVTGSLVDRVGRRPLLLVSCGGTALCYAGLVLFYCVPALQGIVALPLVLVVAAGFLFSAGMAFIPWCLVGEMFPLRARRLGGSLLPACYSAFNVLAVYAFSPMMAALGASGIFLFHGAVMVAGFFFTLLVLPETRGLSLAQVETLFERPSEAPPPPSKVCPAADGEAGGPASRAQGTQSVLSYG